MAHKKGAGSSRNGRDSQSKRRGVKEYGGAQVPAGSILVRQKGTVIRAGRNVGMGRDFTLYAKVTGMVHFDQGTKERRRVNIVPAQAGGES